MHANAYSCGATRRSPLPSPTVSLPTPSDVLNAALTGGLKSSRITQISAASCNGKTLLAISLAAAALREHYTVDWLETSTSLHSINVALQAQTAQSTGLNTFAITSFSHALAVLQALQHDVTLLSGNTGRRMLVLDSVASLLSPLLGLREGMWTGHVAVQQLAVALRWHARAGAIVLVINRLTRAGVPALGNAWTTLVDTQLVLKSVPAEADEEERGLRVSVDVSCKRAPSRTCVVELGAKGVTDVSS